jgi:hypothetical protein
MLIATLGLTEVGAGTGALEGIGGGVVGGVGAPPQILKPALWTEPSVYHTIVDPAATAMPCGDCVPEYVTPFTVRRS